jgi:hypothetical protein
MAYEVLYVIAARLEREGRLSGLEAGSLLTPGVAAAPPPRERPPILSTR